MSTHFHDSISWRGSTTACYRHLDYFCYLVHFSEPIGNPSEPRGVAWEISRLWRVDTWEESRDLEHALKRRHNSPALCPRCIPRLGPDLLVGLRAGHWPLALHARVGRRSPSPRYQNVRW